MQAGMIGAALCAGLLLMCHAQAETHMEMTLNGGEAVRLQADGPWLELLSVDDQRCPTSHDCYHPGHALLVLVHRQQTQLAIIAIGIPRTLGRPLSSPINIGSSCWQIKPRSKGLIPIRASCVSA